MTTVDAPPKSLAEIQHALKRYLFHGDLAVARLIDDSGGLRAHDRLGIYASAYRARLMEALSTDYPALRAVLGDASFAAVCDRYVRAFPSTSFTLRDLGAELSHHVAADVEVPLRAFASELAALEWAFVEAFDARDAPAADARVMAHWAPIDWPGLAIDVHPSVQCIDVHWNSIAMWNAVKSGAERPSVTALPAPGACLVWRQGLATVLRAIDPVECGAWRALAAGATFATLCDTLVDAVEPDAIPLRAATLLHTWLADGLIARLRVSRDPR